MRLRTALALQMIEQGGQKALYVVSAQHRVAWKTRRVEEKWLTHTHELRYLFDYITVGRRLINRLEDHRTKIGHHGHTPDRP